MGFVIVGCMVMFLSPLMTLFPPVIPEKRHSHVEAENVRAILQENAGPTTVKEWWAELLSIAKRLFKNKIYVFTLVGNIFTMMGIIGFAQFLPKYTEFVFRRRASTSGLAGPLMKSISSVCGIITAGFVIGKWKPNASKYIFIG
jgi:hypothetical protein